MLTEYHASCKYTTNNNCCYGIQLTPSPIGLVACIPARLGEALRGDAVNQRPHIRLLDTLMIQPASTYRNFQGIGTSFGDIIAPINEFSQKILMSLNSHRQETSGS